MQQIVKEFGVSIQIRLYNFTHDSTSFWSHSSFITVVHTNKTQSYTPLNEMGETREVVVNRRKRKSEVA